MEAISVRAENSAIIAQQCPFVYVAQVLGTHWRPAVLYKIAHGVSTYNALRAALRPITDKTLAAELIALCQHNLIERIPLETKPTIVRAQYVTTDRGRSLIPILNAMERWAESDQGRCESAIKPFKQKRRLSAPADIRPVALEAAIAGPLA